MARQIQWYPGHMSKTIRELQELTRKVDMFFVLLDARAPRSTFVDSIKQITNNKKVTIVLTKVDLVKRDELKKWISLYKEQGFPVTTMNTQDRNQSYRQLVNMMKNTKVKALIPKFAIIGVPNVGKSTLLNIIRKKTSAVAEDRAGVTKKVNWYQVEKRYWLLDTPGILQPSFEEGNQGMALAATGAIKIEILPMHELATILIERLHGLGVNTKYEVGNEEESIMKAYQAQTMSELDFYKRIIQDFQRLNFGKVILDRTDEEVTNNKELVLKLLSPCNFSAGDAKNLAVIGEEVVRERCESITEEEIEQLKRMSWDYVSRVMAKFNKRKDK